MTVDIKVMEVKKSVPVEVATSQRWSIFDFVGSVKEEFGKITWTEPNELRLYCKLVVGATFIFGLGIYCIDLAIQSVLGSLGVVFHYIFG